jgi:type IV pilus assembly protein PilV
MDERDKGFTLLEVLIALLVLSIGLLGLAGLQTVGLRSNQMAIMRTLATQSACEMSDRMHANPAGVDAQAYVFGLNAGHPDTAVNCTATQCNPEQMAAYDVDAWLTRLEELPGGRGSISRGTSGGIVTHTVTVYWDEKRSGATGTDCGPNPAVDLRCIQLTL